MKNRTRNTLALAALVATGSIGTGLGLGAFGSPATVGRQYLWPAVVWIGIAAGLAIVSRRMTSGRANRPAKDLENRSATAGLEKELAEVNADRRLQDRFVADTVNDVLSPLTVIITSLEALMSAEMADPEDVTATATKAYRAATRVKRLAENLLLTSGVMTRVQSERLPFDVDEQLRAAVRAVESRDKIVYLRVRKPLFGTGDAERFRVAVQNLLVNTEAFAPAESVIRIDGYEEDGKVHVVVSDQGAGISAEQKQAVFRRFHQVGGNASREATGLGPGLLLARQLTNSMGGELGVDDTEQGTRLHLVLPAAAPPQKVSLPGEDQAEKTAPVHGMLYVPVQPSSTRVVA